MIAQGRAGKLKTGNTICISRKASPKNQQAQKPVDVQLARNGRKKRERAIQLFERRR